MAKFMVLFNSDMQAIDLMANSTPEQQKASMDEWIVWKDEAVKKAGFEFGLPLQPVARVTNQGQGQSDSRVGGYAMMEADSKNVIIELLGTHPHLQRPGATIDVLEMVSMPGISHPRD